MPLGQLFASMGHMQKRSPIQIPRPEKSPLPGPFSPFVVKEAEAIAGTETASMRTEAGVRRDFRNIETITIDPVDAKDFDDALSYQKLANGNREVGIHIADVSYFVATGSALDKEARERATSIYLVDRVIPMLPEALSNNLCSLMPKKERLAYSAVFEFDTQGTIVAEWFGRTIIRSDARLSYEEAQTIMDGGASPHRAMISELTALARILREKKFKDGAIAIHDTELKCDLDASGKPIGFHPVEHTESHQLIEDFMLLANRRVAEFASRAVNGKQEQFVYRIHDKPDLEKLHIVADYAHTLGYRILHGDTVDTDELNRLLKDVLHTPHQYFIHSGTLRSMAKAIYSMKNIGHFGLAFKHYTHFTSPIRRYPDLMVHRLLSYYLAKKKVPATLLKEYAQTVAHATEREIAAAEAERESFKQKQVEYWRERVGATSTGIITGVTNFGVFVREESTGADGLIHVTRLPNDYYIFNEQTMSLVGERTKKIFKLGDSVHITISAADPVRNQLDYDLAGGINTK